jgi:hypothetical protein
MYYFNELQERIREIRISKKFFYQKIKDIFTQAKTEKYGIRFHIFLNIYILSN